MTRDICDTCGNKFVDDNLHSHCPDCMNTVYPIPSEEVSRAIMEINTKDSVITDSYSVAELFRINGFVVLSDVSEGKFIIRRR